MVLVVGALLGTLAGAAFPAVVPAGRSATTTLYLSHDPTADQARAMATDVSLLTTRAVAERSISALGLSLPPEDVLASVTAASATSDLLVITMTGPTAAEAARRLDALARVYLEFRGAQVSAPSDALIRGISQRITVMQTQLDAQSKIIAGLAGGRDDGSGRLNEAISRRAQLSAQISALQQTMQDEMLRRSAVVSASRVIDPAAAEPPGGLFRVVLYLVAGTIGGTAVVFAGIVLASITSDRIRLRVELAAALEAPVRATTGAVSPPSVVRRAVGGGRAWRRQGAVELRRAAHVVQRELVADREDRRLAVASVDCSKEVCLVVAAAALAVRPRVGTVHLVDLTVAGGLEPAMARLARDADADPIPVVRPRLVPSIAAAPPPLGDLPGEERPPVPGPGEVLLIAADLDEGIGAEHLGDWCRRVLVTVASGRSGVDRVRTAGDVVRAAGLRLGGSLLTGTEPWDHSSGVYPFPDADRAGQPAPDPGTVAG